MSIVDDFKSLASLAMKVRDAGIQAEMQDAILRAQSQAMVLQQQNSELFSDNTNLKDEIARLQKIDDIEKDLELSDKGFYVSKSSGHKFCGACWATLQKRVPVRQRNSCSSTGSCISTKCRAQYPELFEVTAERPKMVRPERGSDYFGG